MFKKLEEKTRFQILKNVFFFVFVFDVFNFVKMPMSLCMAAVARNKL